MDNDTRNKIRDALLESYKHKLAQHAECPICGAKNKKYAMHIIQGAFLQSMALPKSFLIMSSSGGTLRGGFPICESCAPSCDKCGLPIASRKVKKLFKHLTEQYKSKDSYIGWGNGKCSHLHFFGP